MQFTCIVTPSSWYVPVIYLLYEVECTIHAVYAVWPIYGNGRHVLVYL